jgi:8-oxo-dGTP diphosphatase
MSYRSAIILLENDKIALVERHRQGLHYFTFPGGHVDEGETPEQAAIRETDEELGLQVVIERLISVIWWHNQPQYYFLAKTIGGVFGTGTGAEMTHPDPEKGTYKPVWLPIQELLSQPVKPILMARMVVDAQVSGWPNPAPIIRDVS